MYNTEDFRTWLQEELDQRGWIQADLAAASNMSPSLISKIMRGDRGLGFDSATAIARALRIPTETLLRNAGIIQKLTDIDPDEREFLYLYHQLDPDDQAQALAFMKGYVREKTEEYNLAKSRSGNRVQGLAQNSG